MARRYSVLALIICCFLWALSISQAQTKNHVIEVTAKRFGYEPSQIKLRQPETVELHIRSSDVLHGFSIPELGIRADLLPGQTTVVELSNIKPGNYLIMCDIFCGTEHSSMQATLIVKP